jgi:60 kDa SS-A/Ro ribonucleoprotein
MSDPLASISTRKRATPQSEQADPRQVANSAGGYTFTVAGDARLTRFLTLGTDGGTYYTNERDLTKANAQTVLDRATNSTDGALAQAITDVSVAGRAPRQNPALFALAAASSLGNTDSRRAALGSVHLVARTGTHLYQYAKYTEQFRGWGRGLRTAVGEWYLSKDAGDLAYQVLKYRQREGWTHRDLLRLSHPAGTGAHRELFNWICGRDANLDELPLVEAFAKAQAATRPTEWVTLINANQSLSWEMLPDAALNKPDVWRALIVNGMPQTALMRQLPRLTRLEVIGPKSRNTTSNVAAQLADPRKLAKARVHPINALVALRTYASGQGARGQSTWSPVPQVTDALDSAFYAAFGAIEPANARTLLALDVSGSMTGPVSGLPLSCREASAALALVTAATEPATTMVGFTASGGGWNSRHGTGISTLNISKRQRLDDVLRTISGLPFGGTDCALPMQWALANRVEVDHFSVFTDNETWAGGQHPHEALAAYREGMGINARMSVVGMTSTDFSIADPNDPLTLDVAGFDAKVPTLLADHARGDLGAPPARQEAGVPVDNRPDHIKAYEDRPGPLQGRRGMYWHLEND